MSSLKPHAQAELLLFAFEYPPVSGGIARLCSEIGKILGGDRGTVHVLTQDGEAFTPYSALPTTRVTGRRPWREWRAFRWLKQHWGSAPVLCGIWYPEGLIAYLAGVRPLVILAHGAELLPPIHRWRRPFWIALQRYVLEGANLVIANSEYTRQLISSVAPKTRVAMIPLAVDSNRFAPGDREAAKTEFGVAGKRVLCTVSRIHRYKGHDTVLRAIANLGSEERDQLVYLVVGTGPDEKELREYAVALGIESQVRWLGFVCEEELPQVYRAADLFVLCTRETPEERAVEGFGLVFLEAQSCGVPVLGTRCGGIPSAIRHGEGGWLIEQDDSQKLTDILHQLVHSPELFRAAGTRARERVLRENTWQGYGQCLTAAITRQRTVENTTTAQRL
jgi:phosphatidylinositol alpha-1,6-mannosyltransferase